MLESLVTVHEPLMSFGVAIAASLPTGTSLLALLKMSILRELSYPKTIGYRSIAYMMSYRVYIINSCLAIFESTWRLLVA